MHRQMSFFLQSVCLGIILGVVFDVLTGLGRNRTMKQRLWLDILFGPLAALLLFIGGLVIMDGQIHPSLVLGSITGMVVEHLTIGVCLSKSIAFFCRFSRKTVVLLLRKIELAIRFLSVWWQGMRQNLYKRRKVAKK